MTGSLWEAHHFAATLADQLDAALARFHSTGSGVAAPGSDLPSSAAPSQLAENFPGSNLPSSGHAGTRVGTANGRRLVAAAPHITEQRRSGWGLALMAAGGAAGLAAFTATRPAAERTSGQPQNEEKLAMDMEMGTSV